MNRKQFPERKKRKYFQEDEQEYPYKNHKEDISKIDQTIYEVFFFFFQN